MTLSKYINTYCAAAMFFVTATACIEKSSENISYTVDGSVVTYERDAVGTYLSIHSNSTTLHLTDVDANGRVDIVRLRDNSGVKVSYDLTLNHLKVNDDVALYAQSVYDKYKGISEGRIAESLREIH